MAKAVEQVAEARARGLRTLLQADSTTQIIGAELAEEEEETGMDAQAWDDVSGSVLNPAKVRRARLQELQYVRDKEVWRKIPRWQAKQQGIPIIATRWIDINKGDEVNENYRSRLVAKEFNMSREMGLFAATPPLEALKFLLSIAATSGKSDGGPRAAVAGKEGGTGGPRAASAPRQERNDKVMMVNDVARAFFEAPIQRRLCVELPQEDKGNDEEDMVGLL